ELVDQAQLGRARQDGRQVHLVERQVAVAHAPARHDLEAAGLGGRLRALVRLEVADHHVAPALRLAPALLQHPGGLPDPRGHAEDRLVPAAADRAHGRMFLRAELDGHQAPSRLWTTRSISLMPMNGAISPPTP